MTDLKATTTVPYVVTQAHGCPTDWKSPTSEGKEMTGIDR